MIWMNWPMPINRCLSSPFFPIFAYSHFWKKKILNLAFLWSTLLSVVFLAPIRGPLRPWDGSRRFADGPAICLMEAPWVSGRKGGGSSRVGDRNGEAWGQGCGVRRKPCGGGPVGGESPPTLQQWGGPSPGPGRSQVLRPTTWPTSRSTTWSSIQPRLRLWSSFGLGSGTTSCSARLFFTCRVCTPPFCRFRINNA